MTPAIPGLALRLARVALVAMLLAAALAIRSLALPESAVACSCAERPPGAPIFTGEEVAVLVGTAGPADARGHHEFAVERWFKGGDAAVVKVASATLVLADGTTMIDTCGVQFEVGDHLILAAAAGDGALAPGSCLPHAPVESPEGQQLLAAAVRTFGDGIRPGAEPSPPSDTRPDPGPDLAGLAFVGIAGIVLLVLAAVVVAVARGERRGGGST